MGIHTNAIRAACDAIDADPPAGGVLPALDCWTPIASPPALTVPESGTITQCHTCFLRAQDNVPDGAIPMFGDSITQAMCTADMPGVVNYGIAGQTLRQWLNRINGYTCVPRAGAMIIALGVCDLGEQGMAHYPEPLDAAGTVNVIWSNHIKPHMTGAGKYIIVPPLPVTEGSAGAGPITNTAVAMVEAMIRSLFYASANVRIIDTSGIPQGPDGLHPAADGYAVLKPRIAAARVSLSI
jgi:lysophospholipase L1-like esterase